jgi:hypothetical protein
MSKPTMQRRHFELIAETIRYADLPDECRAQLTAEFARALKGTNEHFDGDKFVEACQPVTTYRNRSR